MKIETLLEADARWSSKLRVAEQPGVLRTLAALIAHSGDSWFWGIGLGLFLLLGNSYQIYVSFHMLASIFVTAVIVLVLKLIVRRRRPEGKWGGIYRNTDPHSFPSGHAARATMLMVLSIGLWPSWLAAIMILWAPLVSLARVSMGVHYLSDVIAGSFLGFLIGVSWLLLLT
ncbi:MAG: phosphatase PAP2 family protein [Anaerolineales bacterium]|nr:phosphatase PAP2 family protein [Anaerolineales bacterium]